MAIIMIIDNVLFSAVRIRNKDWSDQFKKCESGSDLPVIYKSNMRIFSVIIFQVRASLYKLRHTWTAAPLFSARLQELDLKA